jgi:hypothetical protein
MRQGLLISDKKAPAVTGRRDQAMDLKTDTRRMTVILEIR